MNFEIFNNINKIIERDSKSTTYKFALLRGVIELINEKCPFIILNEDRVHFPMKCLVDKWLIYYYPILESEVCIPQINGTKNRLAFQQLFLTIISAYNLKGGLSKFYIDLTNDQIPDNLRKEFYLLTRKVCNTITEMPMKHIGYSLNHYHYSIFKPDYVKPPKFIQSYGHSISNYKTFSIPRDYFEAFRAMGTLITGQDSLLHKWAEFSVNASGRSLSTEKVLNEVLKSPVTERDCLVSKTIYRNILETGKNVYCVWTGNKIKNYDIDHLIPFSVWKNNDLWNLLPSTKETNNKKRDKIPSAKFIEERKDVILHYWDILHQAKRDRFRYEIQNRLIGQEPGKGWRDFSIIKLQEHCDYLINTRGYNEWVGQ